MNLSFSVIPAAFHHSRSFFRHSRGFSVIPAASPSFPRKRESRGREGGSLMSQQKTAVGYLLPTREVVMAQATPDCGRIVQLAESAETLGFDSVWVGDSILARPRLEPLTTLAAAASRTSRVKLGTAVLLPALRHPVVLANEIRQPRPPVRRPAHPGPRHRRQQPAHRARVRRLRRRFPPPHRPLRGRRRPHAPPVDRGGGDLPREALPARRRAPRAPPGTTFRHSAVARRQRGQRAPPGAAARRRLVPRCPTPRKASPATGSGSNPWPRKRDRTPPVSPAPCTSPST